MSEYIQKEQRYLIFGIKSSKFAVPVDIVRCLLSVDTKIPSTLPPDTPPHIKRLIEMDGDFFPVVELPDFYDIVDADIEENIILVFEQNNKNLGLLVHDAHITTINTNEITSDDFSATSAFIYKETPHILVDVPKLYEYAEI